MAYAWGSTNNSANAAAGTSLTLAITLATGERVLVWTTWGQGSSASEAVDDGGTNTWTKLFTLSDTTNNQSVALFECKNAVAGSYTLTLSTTSQTYRGLAFIRTTGLDTSAAAVTASTNNVAPGSGADAVTSGNLTPAAANGGMIGICFDDSGGETIAAGTGYTGQGVFGNVDTAFGTGSRIEDKTVSSTSAQAAVFTATGGGGRFLTAAWAVQDAAGGGGGSIVPVLMAQYRQRKN